MLNAKVPQATPPRDGRSAQSEASIESESRISFQEVRFLHHTGRLRDGDDRKKRKTKVVTARGFHLFPFRTEKLNPATPMVLRKWESR